ncbi:MAG: hypothetical protein N4A71_06925 [Carboxylicivirga sp.]|jgi:hypothetical protein|nr:hypothetical protein [Carboxylicivirga sp.]
MKKVILYGFLMALGFIACEPRVDMDMSQWGDTAYIDDVLPFVLEEDEHTLAEWYVDSTTTTTGIRRVWITHEITIDSLAAEATISLAGDIDLTKVGIAFKHQCQTVAPMGNSPKAGYINDFSNGPFKYQLRSADGTVRDWTVIFDPEN